MHKQTHNTGEQIATIKLIVNEHNYIYDYIMRSSAGEISEITAGDTE